MTGFGDAVRNYRTKHPITLQTRLFCIHVNHFIIFTDSVKTNYKVYY